MRKEDGDLIAEIKAMLSPDATQKLEKFDRYKQALDAANDQKTPPAPPTPQPLKKDGAK